MSILLTILILIVVLGTVFAFARIYVRKSTRGSATQAANLFSSYPESTRLRTRRMSFRRGSAGPTGHFDRLVGLGLVDNGRDDRPAINTVRPCQTMN
jgi:hypothetical protein